MNHTLLELFIYRVGFTFTGLNSHLQGRIIIYRVGFSFYRVELASTIRNFFNKADKNYDLNTQLQMYEKMST